MESQCMNCGVIYPDHLLINKVCDECDYHNNNEEEVIGYECCGCGNFQINRTGFGCDVCMSNDLNEVYN